MGDWKIKLERQSSEEQSLENQPKDENESGNKKESKLLKILIGILIFIAVFAFIIFMDSAKVNYGETLNMWWMVLYTLMSQVWDHLVGVLIGGIVVYIAFVMNLKWGLVATAVFIVYLSLVSPNYMKEYVINGDDQNFGNTFVNQLKDIMSDEYEIIEPNECKVLQENVKVRGRRNSSTHKYYYLKIDDDKYIIPLVGISEDCILALLKSRGGIEEIKVRKYTKYIVEIDGIKVNELTKNVVNDIKWGVK